jgi:hypothetical protein
LRDIFFILILTSLLISCERVIDYKLDSSDPVIVIEGTLTDSKEPFTVTITKTAPYFGNSESTLVSGAQVSVKVDNGKKHYFTEISPGIYQFGKNFAAPKNWYTLYVEYEGITYTARSYLNESVPLVDCTVTYFEGYGFFDSGYKINCFIKDPPNVENYYRIKMYVNNKVVNNDGEVDVYSDKLFDGKVIGLVQNSSVVFNENDTVVVEVQSIDKAAYNYFSTLESISGLEIIESASPSNPISNFDNDALGYFSAYSFDRRTIIIANYINN